MYISAVVILPRIPRFRWFRTTQPRRLRYSNLSRVALDASLRTSLRASLGLHSRTSSAYPLLHRNGSPLPTAPSIAGESFGSGGSSPHGSSADLQRDHPPSWMRGFGAEGFGGRARVEGHPSAAAAVPAHPSATPYMPYAGDHTAPASWWDASDCCTGGRSASMEAAVAPAGASCDAPTPYGPAGALADSVAGGWRSSTLHAQPGCDAGSAAVNTATAPAGIVPAGLLGAPLQDVAPDLDEAFLIPGLVFTVADGCGCVGASGD